jgi:hypothetical protein
MLGERAKRLKARCLHGKHGSICGGHKRERVGALPGEISNTPDKVLPPRGGKMVFEKSAEAIVGVIIALKG